jgi:hypothetical protein
MVPWDSVRPTQQIRICPRLLSDGILPTRRRPGMPACIWDTGGPAPPEGRSPRPQSAPERHRAWNVNRASFHDISKTIRTTGSHVRVPDTRTDRRKIGLGHRHRWLCRAGDRRLALRAVRREHHIRPPSVRRNQKRAQRGRASSIKAPAQGKRSDNAAAWPEVMTTQIIAIRGRLTWRRVESPRCSLADLGAIGVPTGHAFREDLGRLHRCLTQRRILGDLALHAGALGAQRLAQAL